MTYDPEAPFPRRDKFVTPWKELRATEPPEMLVEGLLPKGQVIWLYGETGIGKSLVASSVAQAVAYGDNVFGAYKSKVAPVLWLDYEIGTPEHLQRLEHSLFLLDDVEASANYFIGTFPESITQGNAQDLLYEIGAYNIGLLVIDSAGVGIEGDSNSADTYADFAQFVLNPLKKMGVTVLILDNMGKDTGRGAIGSSRKMHEASVAWRLTYSPTAQQYTLTATKRRVLGVAESIGLVKQLEPLRFNRTDKEYSDEVTPDQENMIMFLDTLEGAKWMGVRALKGKIRDAGFKGRDAVIQHAIKVWDKGGHDAI